jgi:hypothetical protein
MRRGSSKKRLANPYEITVSAKVSTIQKRTLQMFVEKFGLLHEGEAFRIAIESYMSPLLSDENPEPPKDFRATRPPAVKISSKGQPAMDPGKAGPSVSQELTSDDDPIVLLESADEAVSDDGMAMPKMNIPSSTAADEESDEGPLTAALKNREKARYEAEPDRWTKD